MDSAFYFPDDATCRALGLQLDLGPALARVDRAARTPFGGLGEGGEFADDTLCALPRLRQAAELGFLPDNRLGQFSASQQQLARQAVIDGWQQVFPGDTPPLESLQAVQSIGAHEGSYGLGWKSGVSPVSGNAWQMVGSNNWGAVQCKGKPVDGVCPDGCGLYTDSRPTAQGQVSYDWCYVRYATPADGAAGIVRILTHMPKVLAALPSGNLDEIAWQMREAHYFEGFSTDHRVAARAYAAALDKQAVGIAAALGEAQVAARKGEGTGDGGDTSTGTSAAASSGDWVWPIAIAIAVGAAAAAGSKR